MTTRPSAIFDYRALRLATGFSAIALPFVVIWVAKEPLSSISAAYHTNARDWFVGILFFVAAFLMAYSGHTVLQSVSSRVAAIAAIAVAIYPTSINCAQKTVASNVHFIAAFMMFVVLFYFCVVFYRTTRAGTIKQRRRSGAYLVCAVGIALSVVTIGVVNLVMDCETVRFHRVSFYGEAAALCFFGFAWLTAGKAVPFMTDPEERLKFPSMR